MFQPKPNIHNILQAEISFFILQDREGACGSDFFAVL